MCADSCSSSTIDYALLDSPRGLKRKGTTRFVEKVSAFDIDLLLEQHRKLAPLARALDQALETLQKASPARVPRAAPPLEDFDDDNGLIRYKRDDFRGAPLVVATQVIREHNVFERPQANFAPLVRASHDAMVEQVIAGVFYWFLDHSAGVGDGRAGRQLLVQRDARFYFLCVACGAELAFYHLLATLLACQQQPVIITAHELFALAKKLIPVRQAHTRPGILNGLTRDELVSKRRAVAVLAHFGVSLQVVRYIWDASTGSLVCDTNHTHGDVLHSAGKYPLTARHVTRREGRNGSVATGYYVLLLSAAQDRELIRRISSHLNQPPPSFLHAPHPPSPVPAAKHCPVIVIDDD